MRSRGAHGGARKAMPVVVNGQRYRSISALSRVSGVATETLRARYKAGLRDDALLAPVRKAKPHPAAPILRVPLARFEQSRKCTRCGEGFTARDPAQVTCSLWCAYPQPEELRRAPRIVFRTR